MPAQDYRAGQTWELTPLSGGHQPAEPSPFPGPPVTPRPTGYPPSFHPPLLPSPRGPPQVQALPTPYSLQTVLLAPLQPWGLGLKAHRSSVHPWEANMGRGPQRPRVVWGHMGRRVPGTWRLVQKQRPISSPCSQAPHPMADSHGGAASTARSSGLWPRVPQSALFSMLPQGYSAVDLAYKISQAGNFNS